MLPLQFAKIKRKVRLCYSCPSVLLDLNTSSKKNKPGLHFLFIKFLFLIIVIVFVVFSHLLCVVGGVRCVNINIFFLIFNIKIKRLPVNTKLFHINQYIGEIGHVYITLKQFYALMFNCICVLL